MEKRKTIYVMLLAELLARTGAVLYWVNSGHELADPLTKLPDDAKDTIEALTFALNTGKIRIAYDTESYRKALQKEKSEIRKVSYENRQRRQHRVRRRGTFLPRNRMRQFVHRDVECC